MTSTMRILACCALLLASAPAVAAAGDEGDDKKNAPAENEIVAPSAYLEDIETPGSNGGVMDEVDSAQAQAEAMEKDTHQGH